MNLRYRWKINLALFSCTILYALGLFAPCMTVFPAFGEHTTLVLMIHPQLGRPQSISLISGISTLFLDGKYFIASIVFLFSVAFPLWKLSILWAGLVALDYRRDVHPHLRLLEKTGKFSMLDIFVMAVLVLAIKGLPGGTAVEINWGLIAFALAILLSLFMPYWLKKEAAR